MQKNKIQFLAMVFLFTLPFASSYLYLKYIQNNPQELRTKEYGVFLPVESRLPQLKNQNMKWTLLHVQPSPCLDSCQQSLALIKNVIIRLDKKSHYVSLLDSSAIDEDVRGKLALMHEATIPLALEDGFFILVDPSGLMVLFYQQYFDPSGLLKDLKHALKLHPN